MFRKFIITVICCLSIFALSAVPSYAAGFGGGQRGGGFGSGGVSNNTISTYLSYDALSDLCVEVNYNLQHNVYSSDGFPSSGKYAATIVSRSDGYYIGVYKAGSYTWFRNPSGGFYICKYDVDSLLSSIFSKVSSISSTVSTISSNISSISSTVSTISSNISSMLSGVTGIGGKLDTVINLLTNTEYCCGFDTNSSGTAFPQQTISYSIAEQIVARLNTTMQGKMVKLLKRDGSGASNAIFVRAYISDTNYIKIRVASGSALLCDSTNTIFKVGTDYVSGIYARLNSVNTIVSSIDSRLSTLHADNVGFVGIFNSINNSLGDLNVKLGDLKNSLGGLEVNITGGSSGSVTDLSSIESALSTIIDKMDNLPASVDNIVVNITKDNDAYNVFYVEDENGDKKSVAGDSLSASGKLLQFLYKLIIGSAISDVDSSINGLNDFYFDNAPSGLGEGVTVWD